MQVLLKEIRMACGVSQERYAELLGTTFATINRWENGRAKPGKMAQDKILELCRVQDIPLFDLVMRNIEQKADISLPDDQILLFHGSKRGLSGPIAPISRKQCDFGAGFYMGTDPLQPLTLVCDFERAKFYAVSVKLAGLNVLRVKPDLDWAMMVAYHRGKMDQAEGSELFEKYSRRFEGYDLIAGPIANDRMFYVLDNFFQGNITDVALVQSLSALQLGQQYVAVTNKACGQIRVEKEIALSHMEKQCLKLVSEENRVKGINLANDICKKHRREGKFFDEIMDNGDGGV